MKLITINSIKLSLFLMNDEYVKVQLLCLDKWDTTLSVEWNNTAKIKLNRKDEARSGVKGAEAGSRREKGGRMDFWTTKWSEGRNTRTIEGSFAVISGKEAISRCS